MVTPIVFVPGIMGSRLELSGGPNCDPDDPTADLGIASLPLSLKRPHLSVFMRPEAPCIGSFSNTVNAKPLDIMQVSPVLQSIAQSFQQTVEDHYSGRGWPQVVWTFYGDLLVFLETTLNVGTPFFASVTNPVHAFGYDWRQANAVSARKLALAIDGVLARYQGASQVTLVTHSMGGLVARSACQDSAVTSKVSRVIHVAQPINGAVVAYRRFFTGFAPNIDADNFVLGQFFAHLLGNDPATYVGTISGIPSCFELLPNHRYSTGTTPWLTTMPQVDLTQIYDVYAQQGAPGIVPSGPLLGTPPDFLLPGLVTSLIRQAQAFHVALSDFAHPNTFVLHSTDINTDVGTNFSGAGTIVHRDGSGDGTVPEQSGNGSGLSPGAVKQVDSVQGLEHATLFQAQALIPSAATQKVLAFITANIP
jgi:Lecithin:cholesterol acyltransferase